MNLAAARTELSDRFGADSLSSGRLNTLLNAAKDEFEDFPFDWPWLKTTTTGAAPLTISDLRRVLYVVDSTNRNPLAPSERPTVVDFVDVDLTTTGVPAFWYLTSDTGLSVYPASSSASLGVGYVKFSPALSGDSDTPLIPSRYHSIWVDLAGVGVLKDQADWANASGLQQAVNGQLERVAGVYAMQGQAVDDRQFLTRASEDW